MEKEENFESQIKRISAEFLQDCEKLKENFPGPIQIISHFDTDGISSATILIKTLSKLDLPFTLKIVKNLQVEDIQNLKKDLLTIFLDLASGSIPQIINENFKKTYILNHHQIPSTSLQILEKNKDRLKIINPELYAQENISSSGITYLFSKELISSQDSEELAKLGILGMIGDTLEKEKNGINNSLFCHKDIKKKRGLLIFPSTRPINRTLEFSSNPFIPGVTGDSVGTMKFLKENEIKQENNKYPSILELDEKQTSKIVTGILLKTNKSNPEKLVGDIYLLKMFNKLEDAREISAKINACSRMGHYEKSLLFCMEKPKIKKSVESLYIEYKQTILSGLKCLEDLPKITGKNFILVNAKEKIRETIIGTIASILAYSNIYPKGTAIIAMAHYEDKDRIKISSRNVGQEGKNLGHILEQVATTLKGDAGGHKNAAGGIIPKEKEQEFIETIRRSFEIETIKIKES